MTKPQSEAAFTCTSCGQAKLDHEFPIDKTLPRGRIARCKTCVNKRASQYRAGLKAIPNSKKAKYQWPEKNVWTKIKKRCLVIKDKDYAHYGARGIEVCERWRQSFDNFYADMGARPSPKHSIDRIDNNGNYCKENCRWATHTEQMNNTRLSKFITIDGKTRTITQWCNHFDIDPKTIYRRVKRGLSYQEAFLKPRKLLGKSHE